MRNPIGPLLLMSCLALVGAACGGSSAAGEPLMAGALTGSFEGHAFTPTFGVAMLYMGDDLIAFGDGPINCGSASSTAPPPGTTAIVAVPALDVGTYSSVFVELDRNVGGFSGVGSSDGTLAITASTSDSVTGTIAYDYTSADNLAYKLSGTFQVMRCPN